MSHRQTGASRAGVDRAPSRHDRRTHYPDLAPKAGPSPRPTRVVLDGWTGRRFEVRELPARPGDREVRRFELRTGDLPAAFVVSHPDYPECSCPDFRDRWHCVHVRILAEAELIGEPMFALTSESIGKGVGNGHR